MAAARSLYVGNIISNGHGQTLSMKRFASGEIHIEVTHDHPNTKLAGFRLWEENAKKDFADIFFGSKESDDFLKEEDE